MSSIKALTITQRLVLSTAAQRPNQMILPLPATIRVRGGAQRNLLTTLRRLELVSEIAVDDAAAAWRTDEAGQQIGLRLTPAGLAAAEVEMEVTLPAAKIAGEADEEPREEATSSSAGEARVENGGAPPSLPRRPTGKLGAVLQAVSADTGATLSEIVSLTGWLPHTARAAVTGLRRRGFGIHLITQDDRKAYRLTDAS